MKKDGAAGVAGDALMKDGAAEQDHDEGREQRDELYVDGEGEAGRKQIGGRPYDDDERQQPDQARAEGRDHSGAERRPP